MNRSSRELVELLSECASAAPSAVGGSGVGSAEDMVAGREQPPDQTGGATGWANSEATPTIVLLLFLGASRRCARLLNPSIQDVLDDPALDIVNWEISNQTMVSSHSIIQLLQT